MINTIKHLPKGASQYTVWSLVIYGSHPYTTNIRLANASNGTKFCIVFNLFQPEIVTNVNDCEKERFIDENVMTQF